MDKSIFRKTEAILYDYNNLVSRIELLKLEIKDIEETYKGCGSISYEERTQETNKFNSSVENEILEKERLLKASKIDFNNKVTLKRRIDSAVQGLKDEERKLVELRYINKRQLSWNQIAYVLKYSQEYCRKDLREKAINKIGDTIFYNPYEQEKFKIL
ncbi:sigma factor-like helix-turn-helix DNA-binding protein [Clostridium nitritogenes]|uniref:Sigma factor-like helix-turn-helix DNA-binding protein n=1 Tax=Clostridium nitritogenes TaxID=83340 RepID=A0ABN1LJE3_9CLOT